MSQNIYDDPNFFAGYATLDRSVKGLDGAPEWPAIQHRVRSFQPYARARAGDDRWRGYCLPQ